MSKNSTTRRHPQARNRPPDGRARATAATQAPRGRRTTVIVVGIVVVAIVGVLYAIFRGSSSGNKHTAKGSYQVGSPGIGKTAPGFQLASSTGGNISLAGLRGKTVLLYFQEGLTCQPCWQQLTDLEKNHSAVKAVGINQIVSITTDPINLITQKTKDMGITTPVLSDPNLTASNAYHANNYGMMGNSRDGHTFVLVGPDGKIKWRADYGGAPKYTMFVPTSQLLADLRSGELKP